MLKHLFTSKARIKILTLFLLNPDGEFFIRELTRKLDEQINSIRRELTNLKKLGLLKSRLRNRKKFYVIDKNFSLFNDLRNIIVKSMNSKDHVVKAIKKLGYIDFLLLAGVFVNKDDPVDLLIVGDIDKAKLEEFLNREIETEKSVRFSILTREDFLYRVRCNDKFVRELLTESDNIIGINMLEDELDRLMEKK